jgi:N-acetylneuraminic acid mutarotase
LPPPRHDHSLATDGTRLYLFGGRDTGPMGDFWVYDLPSGRWTEVKAPGPPARFGHNGLFDAPGQRLIVFGGQAGGFFNDIWAYIATAGRWSELGAVEPLPATRYGAAATIDSGERLIVSHGFTDTGRFDDSWRFALTGSAWADVSPPDGTRPIKRCLTRAVWDHTSSRFLMFGGQTDGTPYLGDLWSLTDTSWTEITAEPKPSARNLYSMVWDDELSRALVFGGRTEGGQVNDVWEFSAPENTWEQLSTQGEPPTARNGHDSVWIPGRRSMLVFGGQDAEGDRNDLWELTFSPGLAGDN